MFLVVLGAYYSYKGYQEERDDADHILADEYQGAAGEAGEAKISTEAWKLTGYLMGVKHEEAGAANVSNSIDSKCQ